jgi:GTP-binding protein HflX
LSDTVGFIRDLPTQLVAAFRATLEETVHADVLLHVVDAASTVKHEQMEQVDRVLDEINASGIPQILVMNKIDAAEELRAAGPRIERDETGAVRRVFVSAIEGTGLDLLREALVETAIRLREHPAPHDGDFDPRFDTRRDSLPAHRDELSQSLPNSGSSAKGDEEG